MHLRQATVLNFLAMGSAYFQSQLGLASCLRRFVGSATQSDNITNTYLQKVGSKCTLFFHRNASSPVLQPKMHPIEFCLTNFSLHTANLCWCFPLTPRLLTTTYQRGSRISNNFHFSKQNKNCIFVNYLAEVTVRYIILSLQCRLPWCQHSPQLDWWIRSPANIHTPYKAQVLKFVSEHKIPYRYGIRTHRGTNDA